ncbi:MAG: mechanosensitive ion channel family protein, partial [Muribaculaceae bacterium]|nr:mechanosensitive ion channel family protein [Muribaculaceae bacterium]
MGIINGLILLTASKTPESVVDFEKVSHNTLIPSHDFAVWLLGIVDNFLDLIGLSHQKTIEEIIYTALILGVSLLIGVIIKKVALFIVQKFVALRHGTIAHELLEQRVFTKCGHFIPPLVFLCLIPFAFTSDHQILSWILRLGGVYLLVTIAIAICAIFEFIWYHFNKHDNQKNLPLKGILNVGKGIVWIIITIIAISILVDKSPMALLAGLGAFAAALMLIFKDSILGFVAGIQLSNNDMLRVGDWIVVPSTIANGIVIDVTLSVVKVRNWDNTIVMLPPYTLVSTSFQNWRGMQDSGYRLFNRSIYIDQSTITPTTDEMLDRMVKLYPILTDFVNARKLARQKGEGNTYNPSTEPNGTIDTNLGLFRAYICLYLLNHPQVGAGQDLLVKLEAATEYGQPLNIYFYSKLTSWTPYAALGSEIYEHIAVVANDFGLTLYNAPDRNRFIVDRPQA